MSDCGMHLTRDCHTYIESTLNDLDPFIVSQWLSRPSAFALALLEWIFQRIYWLLGSFVLDERDGSDHNKRETRH